jgi:hypothetical protein
MSDTKPFVDTSFYGELNKPVYWKTKSGELINVDDMTESHLRNVLKMLIRNNLISKLRQPERDDKWSHLYSDYLEDIDQHRFTYPGCL